AHYQAGLDTGVLSVDVSDGVNTFHSVADHQANSVTLNPVLRASMGTNYNIEVSNTGDANSRMSSLPSSDMAFSNLAPNAQPLTVSLTVTGTSTVGAALAAT